MKDTTLLSRRKFLETLPCLALSAGLLPGCSKQEASAQSIKTACRLCGVKCGLDVSVKGGKIIQVKGNVNSPVNKGYLCAMGLAAKEIVYSPERLKHPLIKDGNGWKKIGWEEALTTIAQKLQADKKTHGAQSLVVHTGKALVGSETGADYTKFCAAYGTPNRSSVGSQCSVAGVIASDLTFGARPKPEIKNTRFMICWGTNPWASNPIKASGILAAKERGAKLAVIDPRLTPIARDADLYLQIRPGTDCALALAVANIIISEHLYDEDFVKNWTIGFDQLAEAARQYPVEKAEKITGLPSESIMKLAHMYAKTKPACIIHGNALQVQSNGIQILRGICVLQAITGYLDVPGGEVFEKPRYRRDLMPILLDPKPVGADKYPLWAERRRGAQANLLPEAILTGKPYPIKNMIVVGGNPVVTAPNSKKWKDALDKLELLVVMDLFMSDTAKLAHLVLPATMFFERKNMDTPPVIDALGECRPTSMFISELAKMMNLKAFFAKEKQLMNRYRKYAKKGFRTPSGKVELYSSKLAALGYDPLPAHHEPDESPVSRQELARQYPLILISGARLPVYMHSRYRNIPSLRKQAPDPQVDIHQRAATHIGVSDGEEVIVESPRGSIRVKAKVTDRIHPGVVSISHGWSQANVNLLTNDEGLDPISGFPSYNGLLCKVRKV